MAVLSRGKPKGMTIAMSDMKPTGSNSGDLPEQPRKFVERRKKSDWVVNSVTIVAILGWISALVALLLLDRSSPAHENFITRFLSVSVVSFWDTTLIRGAFAAVLASVIVSVVGFFLNATRHRRKTDRYNKLLISIGVVSIIIFVFYLINFGSYLRN